MRLLKGFLISVSAVFVGIFLLVTAIYLFTPDKVLLGFIVKQLQEHSVYEISLQQPASLSRTLHPTLRIAGLETRSKDGHISFHNDDIVIQISLPRLLIGQLEFLRIGLGNFVVRIDETLPASAENGKPGPQFWLPFTPVIHQATMKSLTVYHNGQEYGIPVRRIDGLKLTQADNGNSNIISFTVAVMNEQMKFRVILPTFFRIAYSSNFQASFSLTSPFFDISGSGQVDRSTAAPAIRFEFSGGNPDAERLAAAGRQQAIPGDFTFAARLEGVTDNLAFSVQQASWTGPEQSTAELRGRIDDVTGLSGIALSIDADITRAEWMKPYTPDALGTIKTAAFSGTFTGGHPDLDVSALSFTALTDAGLDLSLTGKGIVALDREFPSIVDAAMKLAFSAPTTRAARILLFDSIPEFGAIRGTADVRAADLPGNTVALQNIVINTRDNKGIKVDLKGSIAGFPLSDEPNTGYRLDVSMKSSSTREFLRRVGLDVPLQGPMYLRYRIAGDTPALELRRIKLDAGDKKQLTLNASGSIGFGDWSTLDPIKSINLDLQGSSVDTAAFARLAGITLPELGMVKFEATTHTISGKHRLENFLVRTTGKGPFRLKANGSASRFSLLPDLVVDGLKFDTRLYPAQAGNSGRPATAKKKARRSVSIDKPAGKGALAYLSNRSNLGMKPAAASRADRPSRVDNLLLFSASGKVASPYNEKPDIALDLQASSDSTQQLAEVFGYDIPEPGPLTARGKLVTRGGVAGIPAANLLVGPAADPVIKAAGHIDNIAAMEGIKWTAGLHLDGATIAKMISAGSTATRTSPGDLDGELVLSDQDGTPGIDSLHLSSKPSADLTIKIDGSYDDFARPESMLLNSHFKARDLQMVGALFNQNWEKRGPVELNTRITHKNDGVLLLSQFTIDKSAMNADIHADFNKTPPRIRGTLRGQNVYVPDFLAHKKSDRKDRKGSAGKDKPIFSKTPLSLDFLNNVDLEITTDIESFDFDNKEEPIRATRFTLRINEGTLRLDPMTIYYPLGQLDLSMEIRSGTTPQYSFTANGRNINPWKDLAAHSAEENFFNSSADMDISLRSSGLSPHDIAAGANGNIYLTLINGRIRSVLLDMLFVDVVGWVINKTTRREYEYFDCSIIDFDVREGVLSTNAFLLNNRRVAVTGEGTIDLGRETVDYTFLPKKNTRILSQADPVHLTGSLRHPKVTALPWKSAATTYGPLIFGPLVFAGTLAADYVAGNVLKHSHSSPCMEYKKTHAAARARTTSP